MRRAVTAGLLWFAAASCGGGDGGGGPAPVDLVTLSGDSTVVVAGTIPLTAAASAGGAPATGVTFQWSANNGNATVSPSGVVTGVARGGVTITAEAVQNGTATGVTATRNLRVRIAAVVIPSAPGTLTSIDDTVTLAAQAKDALNATVGGVTMTWTSTNPAAATVNPTTGLVTAVANGSTSVIAAAQGERAADTVTVTVAQVATTLSVSPHTAGFNRIGATLSTTVTASDARGHAVAGTGITWATRNPAVATVDGAGKITSHATEDTTYVVGASGLLADSVRVVVGLVYASVDVATAGGLPAAIDTAVITQLDGSLQLGLIVKDSGGATVPNPQNIVWALKDSVIAAISNTGLLTGNTLTGQDTVILTARTARDSALLIVRQDVASVAITPASAADLNFVGDTQTFAAQAKDGGGFDIAGKTYTWSTSDTTKLKVDAAGLGTAVGRTSATGVVLRVRALVDGIKDSVNIRVKQVPNSAVLKPFNNLLTAFGQQVAASCVVFDSAGDTIPSHPCTWTTAAPDSGVVTYSPTVAATTNITARKNGDANIQATYYLSFFAPNFVQVQQAATKVRLHPTTADTSRILHDSTMRMIDSVFDANDSLIRSPAPSVTWSSTTALATVDTAGVVTAGASAGNTFIKAVSGTGEDSALVQVTTTPITLSANV
ncbi:MAG TPA: Ig-like domain-containing protein, partial [Gemmatimonadales bacterium]